VQQTLEGGEGLGTLLLLEPERGRKGNYSLSREGFSCGLVFSKVCASSKYSHMQILLPQGAQD
jgi:hypothetical protein